MLRFWRATTRASSARSRRPARRYDDESGETATGREGREHSFLQAFGPAFFICVRMYHVETFFFTAVDHYYCPTLRYITLSLNTMTFFLLNISVQTVAANGDTPVKQNNSDRKYKDRLIFLLAAKRSLYVPPQRGTYPSSHKRKPPQETQPGIFRGRKKFGSPR